jgi:formylglycine-generating enzyme required for sulfatase activity
MVRLPEGYCIDSTEVTRGQYQGWLDGSPSTSAQTSDCTWNMTFAPDANCVASTYVFQGLGSDTHPVSCVDWCDAYAYCQAVGKRLCGKIGGGTVAYGDFADPSQSQWHNACTSHGLYQYPYGNEYQASACNNFDETTSAVGSMSNCQSPDSSYRGVFDLSGNVAEWEDSCFGAAESGYCRMRGSGIGLVDTHLSCGHAWPQGPRSVMGPYLGFRCCSEE